VVGAGQRLIQEEEARARLDVLGQGDEGYSIQNAYRSADVRWKRSRNG